MKKEIVKYVMGLIAVAATASSCSNRSMYDNYNPAQPVLVNPSKDGNNGKYYSGKNPSYNGSNNNNGSKGPPLWPTYPMNYPGWGCPQPVIIVPNYNHYHGYCNGWNPGIQVWGRHGGISIN